MMLKDHFPKLVAYYRRLVPHALRRQLSPVYNRVRALDFLHRLQARARDLVYAPESTLRIGERWLEGYQRHRQRRHLRQRPHWEDHRTYLHTWRLHRDPYFVRSGFYAQEMMRDGCTVLDLSCGDGFYPFYFYSHRAGHVDAVDIDRAAIAHAARYHALESITYYTADITSWSFPREKYDVICWNGAPGHFDEAEILEILQRCRRHLAADGVFCGYEVIETEEQRTWDHKVAFGRSARLREMLGTAFPVVQLYSFEAHEYLNAYFRCGFDLERLTTFG